MKFCLADCEGPENQSLQNFTPRQRWGDGLPHIREIIGWFAHVGLLFAHGALAMDTDRPYERSQREARLGRDGGQRRNASVSHLKCTCKPSACPGLAVHTGWTAQPRRREKYREDCLCGVGDVLGEIALACLLLTCRQRPGNLHAQLQRAGGSHVEQTQPAANGYKNPRSRCRPPFPSKAITSVRSKECLTWEMIQGEVVAAPLSPQSWSTSQPSHHTRGPREIKP